MTVAVFIPARMGSSRFPGKPLADIHGMSMIEHIYRRCAMCPEVDQVFIATCDEQIVDSTSIFGGQALMTSPDHQRATDRVAEAVRNLVNPPEIAVMVQGDEPMVTPEMLTRALEPILSGEAEYVNLMAPIESQEEFLSENTIKVVVDNVSDALYFSRSPIPNTNHGERRGDSFGNKQVCIIPFTRQSLMDYSSWDQTPLEIAESVDMMRILENGRKVRMVPISQGSVAVDTREDLERVRKLMLSDSLMKEYSHK